MARQGISANIERENQWQPVDAAFILTPPFACRAMPARPARRYFFIRGFMNVFSPGIDQLASELRQRGISDRGLQPSVMVLDRFRGHRGSKSGQISSIALVGHSLGAAAVVDVAKRLREAGLRVAFMATLDPVAAGQASGNVRRLENYYLSNGIGSSIHTDSSFHGQVQNVDLSKRPGATMSP